MSNEHRKEEQPEEGAAYLDRKEFERYMRNARNSFVSVMKKYFPHEQKPLLPSSGKEWTDMRVCAESMLIAFDQMRERILNPPSKSEPAGEKITEIFGVLNLAQAEIRAMYKRTGIIGSTILDKIDNILIPYLDEQKNNNLT